MGFSSFYAGLSGLQAYSSHLNVIGNNLANVNTVAFKSSRTTFQDLLYQTAIGSGANPSQIGLGVQTGTVDLNFTQGSLANTGMVTDIAIQGNGFFVLENGEGGRFYTRAGNFSLDKDGNLVTATGARVMGYVGRDANGEIAASGALSNINVQPGVLAPPRATTLMSATTNLNATARVDDPATPLENEAETFATTVTIVDSLGTKHNLTLTFTPVDTNADGHLDNWTYQATVPGADVAGGTAGTPSVVASGTLTFDANGQLVSPAADLSVTTPAWANGAAAQTVTWKLFGDGGTSLVTGFDGQSVTSSVTQNGYTAGTLRTLMINGDGMVDGIFTNGATLHLARLALATFNNTNGLIKAGFNTSIESTASGAPTIGGAGSGGRGTVTASALELSNVDITQELTDMITAQRGYQANSRIITTSDQIIQEALNLKR